MSQGLPGHHDNPHAVLRQLARAVLTQPRAEDQPVGSPCVSVCRLDAQGNACEGCLRTLDEIRTWRALDDAQRLDVWRAIEVRLDALQETRAP